jgi:hypothetical protein
MGHCSFNSEMERAGRPALATWEEHRPCHSSNGHELVAFLEDANVSDQRDFNALNPIQEERLSIALLERAVVTSGVFNESHNRASMQLGTCGCRSRRDEEQKRVTC